MKKAYLILTISVITAAALLLIFEFYNSAETNITNQYPENLRFSDVYLDDEEYLIYPSDSTDKWNIIFPSGDEYSNLKPEQIALFLKSGEIPNDTTWVIYPQCEYQLTMEDKTIIVESFGRPVCELPYNQTGKLGNLLIKDNK